jgi:hypothetical protein
MDPKRGDASAKTVRRRRRLARNASHGAQGIKHEPKARSVADRPGLPERERNGHDHDVETTLFRDCLWTHTVTIG